MIPQRTFVDWTRCFSQPWAGFSFPRLALQIHDRPSIALPRDNLLRRRRYAIMRFVLFNATVGPALCLVLLALPPLLGAGAGAAHAADTASLLATAASLLAFMVMLLWIAYYLRLNIRRALLASTRQQQAAGGGGGGGGGNGGGSSSISGSSGSNSGSKAEAKLRGAQRSVLQVVLLVAAIGPGALAFLVLMSAHPFFRGRMYLCVQLTASGANAWHLLVLHLWGRRDARAARRRSSARDTTRGDVSGSGFGATSAAVDSNAGGTWFAGGSGSKVTPNPSTASAAASAAASTSGNKFGSRPLPVLEEASSGGDSGSAASDPPPPDA